MNIPEGRRRIPTLSIVVPCYNEEAVIGVTHDRLSVLVEHWVKMGVIRDFEIIYVNDGSGDETLSLLTRIAEKYPRVKVIAFSGNFGHQAALSAGLHHASGDAVASLDADLQDPPEVIEQMLAKYRDGYDVVCGVRNDRRTDSRFKRATAQGFYRLMRMMGVDLVHNHADFRLLSRGAVEAFRSYGETNRFIRGMVPAMGFPQSSVEYARGDRIAGETKYPLKKMLAFAVEGITSFSYVPLRLASITGFLVFVLTMGMGAWALATRIRGNAVPGWASTVLPIYFLGGLQLVFLGIIGEYLGKMYLETKKRPLYIVKKTVNFGRREQQPQPPVDGISRVLPSESRGAV